jgi:hypothetical protein
MKRKKINIISKILLISIFLIALSSLMFYYDLGGITGYAGSNLNISIRSRTRGQIHLDYAPIVNLTTSQNMTAEFVNTGSTNYTAQIQIVMYIYNETTGSLEELAEYIDNSVLLYPGQRKSFSTSFRPNRIGTYYIKVRVPYDARVGEYWGSFFVVYYHPYQPPQVIHVVTYEGGGIIPAQKEMGLTGLNIEYDNKLDLYPGQEILFTVNLSNTGTVNLHNLKFQSSTTEYIDFEVNPKEIYELGFNESSLFLVSLKLSENTPPGQYDFAFEILGLEVSRSGNIKLNITPYAKPPMEDEIYDTILNYEYLITELNREIYETSLKGFNTSRAEVYLDNARKNLKKARDHFDNEEYDDAKDALDSVKRDLEKVVFELAAISFRVYIYPAYSPFLILILLLMITIGIITAVYLYKKKKKKGKPKIIKEFTEEET